MLRLPAQLPLPPLLLRCWHNHHKSTFSQLLSLRCHSLNRICWLILSKTLLLMFQSRRPQCSFILNQREGIRSFFTALFRTLDFTYTFIFTFFPLFLFSFVSDFTLSTCVLFYLYIFTFYTFTLPILLLLSQKQTTPKKGRDIISDILNKVLNRAFWRQNYIHF